VPIIPQIPWACNAQRLGGGAQPLCIAAPRTLSFFANSCGGGDLPIKRKRRADVKNTGSTRPETETAPFALPPRESVAKVRGKSAPQPPSPPLGPAGYPTIDSACAISEQQRSRERRSPD